MRSHNLIKLTILIAYIFFPAKKIFSENVHEVIANNVKCPFEENFFNRNLLRDLDLETVDVINHVKDENAIAVDIGAGIGTTSICLSKNFYQVLAVEHDLKSIERLSENLQASQCTNILLCDRPVSRKNERYLFSSGIIPIYESMAQDISEHSAMSLCERKSITFKQLVYDYISAKDDINKHKISFIKCDIYGREENILEDVLHYAYYNGCSVYVSFYLDQWKDENITDYEYLFRYFKTNCPVENLSSYLLDHPSASILFEPLPQKEILVKKNTPVLIIGFNQVTFIKNMVDQLEKYTSDICVIDNKSDFQPLLDYYENEYKYTLLKQPSNYGHTVYQHANIQKLVGDIYILTDPDLQFNPNLPPDFIESLINISNHFKARKVGFALLIDSDDIRTDIRFLGRTIKEWEHKYWQDKIYYPLKPSMELYRADLDTTFCLINKRHTNKDIRVAGDFTCMHIPWHKSFQEMLKKGEAESYLKNNKSTTWFGKNA